MKLIVVSILTYLVICSAELDSSDANEPLEFVLGLYSEEIIVRARGDEAVHKYIGFPTKVSLK